MDFSKEQQLIIAMLVDLARPAGQRELDFNLIGKAVAYGSPWAIEWRYPGLFSEKTDKREELDFVVDVLDMWSFIESSFRRLPEADQKQVEAENYNHAPRFPGFDGNNESTLMGIAHMITEDLDRFGELKGRGGTNSHSPTIARYRGMLDIFLKIRPTLDGRGMSKDQIMSVLKRDQ